MRIVVDASIAAKFVIIEHDYSAAMSFAENEENTLIAPELVLAEVGNVLWKKQRRNEVTILQVQHALADILDVFDELVPIGELIGAALDYALTLDHPIYDCFYLTCARKMDARIVSADRRFRATAERSGMADMFVDFPGEAP